MRGKNSWLPSVNTKNRHTIKNKIMKKRFYKDVVCTIELMYKRKIRKAKNHLYTGKVNQYLKELIEASELREMHSELRSLV